MITLPYRRDVSTRLSFTVLENPGWVLGKDTYGETLTLRRVRDYVFTTHSLGRSLLVEPTVSHHTKFPETIISLKTLLDWTLKSDKTSPRNWGLFVFLGNSSSCLKISAIVLFFLYTLRGRSVYVVFLKTKSLFSPVDVHVWSCSYKQRCNKYYFFSNFIK